MRDFIRKYRLCAWDAWSGRIPLSFCWHGWAGTERTARVLSLPRAFESHQQSSAVPAHLLQTLSWRNYQHATGAEMSRMSDLGDHESGRSASKHSSCPSAGGAEDSEPCAQLKAVVISEKARHFSRGQTTWADVQGWMGCKFLGNAMGSQFKVNFILQLHLQDLGNWRDNLR